MSLFKFFGRRPSLPEWAAPLNDAQYSALWKAVKDWIRIQGTDASFNEGEGWLKPGSGFLEGSKLYLHNLVPGLSKLNPKEVEQSVTGYFQGMWDRQQEVNWANSQSYDRIADLLRIRIFPKEALADLSGPVIYDINDSLVAALFMDLPTTMAGVTGEVAERWGVSLEDAIAKAIERTEEEFLKQVQGGPSLPVGIIFELHDPESFTVASGILSIPRLFPSQPRFGVVLSVPSRSHLLGIALEEKTDLQKVEKLGALAQKICQEHPGVITPDLFWWMDSQFLSLNRKAVWDRFVSEAVA